MDLRLQTLRTTRLLDSPPERSFDRLTRLAARLLKTPVALVSLVDERRQFFKSACGLKEPWASARETPLSHSFCQFAVRDRRRFVVNDARTHPLVQDNLAVRDLGVVAYAGIPLMIEAEAIGAFCVVDEAPREWSDEDLELLEDLAGSVVTEIQLRMLLAGERTQHALLGALIESVGDGVLACDRDGVVLIANLAARRLFDDAVEVGRPMPERWPDEGALAHALQGEGTDGLTFPLQREVWVEASGQPVRDERGEVIGGVAIYRDVTERVRENELHSTILRSVPRTSIAVFDDDLRCIALDGGVVRGREGQREQMIGRTMAELAGMAADDPNFAPVMALYRRALAGEEGTGDYAHRGRVFELHAAPVRDALGRITSGIMLAQDRTVERDLEAAVRRSDQIHRATLENIEDGVALLDADRRIILANSAYSAMFGLPLAKLQALSRADFFAHLASLVDDPAEFQQRVDVLKDAGEYVLVRPRRRVLRRTETAVSLETGEAFLVTWHDVTSERDLLAERERQLHVDALTGIENRRGAERSLALEDARRKRSGEPFSVALFDIDHFKRVNDVHGHAIGDEVLRLAAATLAAQSRLTDHVARWGGEEFIGVLAGSLAGAVAFAERARLAVEALHCPKVERVTISVGVAEVRPGESPADAIGRADAWLYEAKRSGRNRVVGER